MSKVKAKTTCFLERNNNELFWIFLGHNWDRRDFRRGYYNNSDDKFDSYLFKLKLSVNTQNLVKTEAANA